MLPTSPASYFVIGGEKMPVLRNVRGHTVRVGAVIHREVAVLGRDGHGFLRLRVGRREVLAYSTGPLAREGWIRPLVEDDEVRRARAAYERHRVYPTAAYSAGFDSPFGVARVELPAGAGFTVRRIVKVRGGALYVLFYRRVPSRASMMKPVADPMRAWALEGQMRKENANVPAAAKFADLRQLARVLSLRAPQRQASPVLKSKPVR